jgi:4-carboxymuconolactone decarboxylase
MRMLIWFALLIAVVAAASGQSGKGTSAPVRSATLPADIYPDSLNRLPVVKREQLDENGKQVYDHVAGGAGKIASPTGPASIELYSPGAAEPLRRLNEYLRRPGNLLGNAITELAILVAAREGDSQYVWSAHEPAAIKAGIAQPVIDVVKHNKDVSGVGEKETVVILLGRQLLREHKLDSGTFAKVVELFGKQGTVELVTLMGDYTLNGLLLDALDQHLPADRKPLLPSR